MKHTWQGYAVAVLTSLMLGGGGTFLVANSQISHVKAELQEDIRAVEVREQKNFELLIEMSKDLVRLEERVIYLIESLDDR